VDTTATVAANTAKKSVRKVSMMRVMLGSLSCSVEGWWMARLWFARCAGLGGLGWRSWAGLEELGWAGRVGLGWRRRAALEEEGGAGLGGSCWTRGFVLD
jgi:hypothetical protein